MKPVGTYKLNYTIPNRDVDFMKRLRLGFMFGYFQDISSLHSENMGVGVNRLVKDFGVAWILMRMRVDILRTPMLYENVALSTWPVENSKILYDRDFNMTDEAGNRIVIGSSSWILMNLEKRELVKERLFEYPQADYPKEHALPEKVGRIHVPENSEKIFDRLVTYSDVDYNGHMNNTKYIDIMMDSMDMDLLREYEPASIEVNYSREVRVGESLTLYRNDTAFASDGIIYAAIRSAEDDKDLFTGKITLRRME